MNHQFFSPRIHVAADALPGLGIATAKGFSIVLPLGSASAAQDQTSVDHTRESGISHRDRAQANVSAIPYNGQFPGSLLRFKERLQGHGRYLQRHSYAGTAPLP
jgi:hypothetical protein